MPTLKQGSSGPEVKALQQQLKDLGFDPNGVDGNFGPGTRAALIAFQQSKGLQPDGIAGPATLATLQAGDGSTNASSPAAPQPAGTGDAATGGATTDSAINTGGTATATTPSRTLTEDDYELPPFSMPV